jgi:hypothetical protein
MSTEFEAALDNITAHLTSERQAWLFGAGISCCSGLPLMGTLTDLVTSDLEKQGGQSADLFGHVRSQLSIDCHIEHILSQLGDLIALAERSRNKDTFISGNTYTADVLRNLHGEIRDTIRCIIRFGYHPKNGEIPPRIATEEEGVINVDLHRRFIRTLFAARDKVGRPQRPVQFFTLNYDTLLEDALALERVSYVDGFSGGAMAYWSPATAYSEMGVGGLANAQVFKLHGSVDWHADDDGSVYRCRDGRSYPNRDGNVLIYPQSTKYLATQKDPFAKLFEKFRSTLGEGSANALAICGYSFGDEHVDLEIEAAMTRPESKTVIIAFTQELQKEDNSSLPPRLTNWLSEKTWRGRVFAVTNCGLYHGSMDNLCREPQEFDWWTFEGLTRYLSDGPQQTEPKIPDQVVTLSPAGDEEKSKEKEAA